MTHRFRSRNNLNTEIRYGNSDMAFQIWPTQSKFFRLSSLYLLLKLCRYEYVKSFEQPDVLLPNTWIVVRIDGRGFHK
jgi:hypothetical protein